MLATTSTKLATATARPRSIVKGHRAHSGDQKQHISLLTQALSCCRTAFCSHGLADWRLPRFVSAGIEFRRGARSRLPADGPHLDLQRYLRPFSYPERHLNILQSLQVVSELERKAFPTSRFTTSLQAAEASVQASFEERNQVSLDKFPHRQFDPAKLAQGRPTCQPLTGRALSLPKLFDSGSLPPSSSLILLLLTRYTSLLPSSILPRLKVALTHTAEPHRRHELSHPPPVRLRLRPRHSRKYY